MFLSIDKIYNVRLFMFGYESVKKWGSKCINKVLI